MTHDEIQDLIGSLDDIEEGETYTTTYTPDNEAYIQIMVFKTGTDSYNYTVNTIRHDLLRDELVRELSKELS